VKHPLLVALLALMLTGSARAADGGSVTGSVVVNPAVVAFSLSSTSVSAGSPFGVTATVSNLGTSSLSNVDVTLQLDSSVGGASTKTLASIAGGGTGSVSWQLCGAVPGNYVLLAKAQFGAFSSESAAQVLQITAGTGTCPEKASAVVPPGGTISTDGEGDGATVADPLETSILTPTGGSVFIDEQQSVGGAPAGLTILGWQVQISAPSATAGTPLRFTFELDSSLLGSLDPLTVQVSRNGLVVSDCTGASGIASPDPCVVRRALQGDGDLELVVLTSAASLWTFGTVYPFSGFFQPVDDMPTLNALQAGRSVPVKFALGGDRGLGILASGYPASQRIACDANALVDSVEQTLASSASGLSYDPVTGQYAYTWKTDKAWAGTCRELVLRLVDGTQHRARFQLR
jgi:hypothetical protein